MERFRSESRWRCFGSQLDGRHDLVQEYFRAPKSASERPLERLVGFTRVTLSPAESKNVSMQIPVSRLEYFDKGKDDFVVEPIEYELLAARHSLSLDALSVRL